MKNKKIDLDKVSGGQYIWTNTSDHVKNFGGKDMTWDFRPKQSIVPY